MLSEGFPFSLFYSLSATPCNYCPPSSFPNSKTKSWVAKVLSKVFLMLSLSPLWLNAKCVGFTFFLPVASYSNLQIPKCIYGKDGHFQVLAQQNSTLYFKALVNKVLCGRFNFSTVTYSVTTDSKTGT